MDIASKEDLNLIDLAVDDEHDECREDWTSKLGINLRYCVKVRKNSSSKQVQHALTLGGLFSKQSPSSDFQRVKWQSKRSRSKKLNHPAHCRPCGSIEKKDEVVERKADDTSFKRDEKIIQYSRRNYKLKAGDSTGAGRICGYPATCGEGDKHSRMASESNIRDIGNSTSGCARFYSSKSNRMSETYPVVQMLEATKDISLYSTPSQVAAKLATTTLIAEGVEAQVENHSSEGRNMYGEGCGLVSRDSSDMQDEIAIPEEASENKSEAQMVNTVMEISCMNSEVCDSMTLGDEVQQENQTTNKRNDNAPVSCSSHLLQDPTFAAAVDYDGCTRETHIADEFSKDVSLEFKLEEEIKSLKGRNEEPSLSPTRQINEPSPASIEGTSGVPRELCAAEDSLPGPISCSEEFRTADRSEGEHVSTSVTQMEITQPCISMEESSQVPRGCSSEEGPDNGVTSETVQQEVQTTNRPIKEPILGLVIETENQPTSGSVEEFEVLRVTCATDNINGFVALDNKEQRKTQTTNSSEELIYSQDIARCQPLPASIQTYSRIKREPRASQGLRNSSEVCLSPLDKELESIGSSIADPAPIPEMGRKRKREVEQIKDDNFNFNGFIRGPCEGLRPRAGKDAMSRSGIDNLHKEVEEKPVTKKVKKPLDPPNPKYKKEQERKSHRCDLEGCRMSFGTKAELVLHKRNRCPHEGCGKRFSSHNYAMIHSRVHDDDRPLKCPWTGCSMSFKWAWARTEHIRVHTGERPYQCKVEGCGLSFRFVSDFSRHRRKTGHYVS